MTDSIAGLPFWDVTFDADGDPDGRAARPSSPRSRAGDHRSADVLATGGTTTRVPPAACTTPSSGCSPASSARCPPTDRSSSASPESSGPRDGGPTSRSPTSPPTSGGGPSGAASVEPVADAAPEASSATLDPQTLADLREVFPSAADVLDRMAALLADHRRTRHRPSSIACLRRFAELAGTPDDDGEGDPAQPAGQPRMLADDARDPLPALPGRAAGERRPGRGRAQRRGRHRGPGPGDLERREGGAAPDHVLGDEEPGRCRRAQGARAPHRPPAPVRTAVRVHLIGHSFGARLVSYALAGLPGRSHALAGQLADPAGGCVLALRLRPATAVRRRPERWPGRPAVAGRRPRHRVLLQLRLRGRPVLPAGVARGGGRLRRGREPALPLGRHGRGRRAGGGRRCRTPCSRRARGPPIASPPAASSTWTAARSSATAGRPEGHTATSSIPNSPGWC